MASAWRPRGFGLDPPTGSGRVGPGSGVATLEVNLGSRSKIMDIGIPCYRTISLIYSSASLSSE